MNASPSAGELLREARTRKSLSQAELAVRAGVSQSVISVYESGRRQPSLPVLARLVAATGQTLELQVRDEPAWARRMTGPVGRRVLRKREALLSTAADHGVRVLGVFGSVARGDDSADSDVDLLVELPAGMGLFELGRARTRLAELLGANVDLVPAADLKRGTRQQVYRDLVPL